MQFKGAEFSSVSKHILSLLLSSINQLAKNNIDNDYRSNANTFKDSTNSFINNYNRYQMFTTCIQLVDRIVPLRSMA